MAAIIVRAPLDRRWWTTVADAALQLGAQGGLPASDLRHLSVIVPRLAHAPLLRAALHAARGRTAFVAPRISTLEGWAGITDDPRLARRAELYGALRDSPWARAAFGAQPAALWALARDVAELADELTLAAVGGPEPGGGAGADAAAEQPSHTGDFEARWRAAVDRHFARRAAAAAHAQTQLVLGLWRASADLHAGAARLWAQLARRAARADGPLLVLAPHGAQGWLRGLADVHARRSPACIVEGDAAALAAPQPWIAAAWPELGASAQPAPIATRARHVFGSDPPALRILKAPTLEAEAGAAAAWVLERLRDGCRSLAIVALDRLAARRVRALLERADVWVADEAGWKLSTTSAAGAVMRWLDLCAGDFDHRDLLDFLKSPFTLDAGGDKAALVETVERALRRDGVHAGVRAVRAAVAREAAAGAGGGGRSGAGVEALAWIDRLIEIARPWREAGPLPQFAARLGATLDALGMRAALARDAVGLEVLAELRRIEDELGADPRAGKGGRDPGGAAMRVSPAEFRALLIDRFEETSVADPGIESPVVMTSLAGTRLRPFEAAILVGADAEHLPSTRSPGALMSNAVRRDLGLPAARDAEREQLVDLASLMSATPSVAATWRVQRDAEPNALAAPLDRLRLLADLAGWPDPLRPAEVAIQRVVAEARPRPAPVAAALLEAGSRRHAAALSASACQSLVDCPYQFYARHLLALRPAEPIKPVPDKRDFGQALHEILLRFHTAWREAAFDRLDAAELERDLGAHADAVFTPRLARQPAIIGYRQRLRSMIPGYVAWLRERARAGWRWQEGESTRRLELQLDGGATVELVGRIDRIDRMDRTDRGEGGRPDDACLELLDYKTRPFTDLRRAQAEPGEDVQLHLYGLLAGPGAGQAAYLSFERPADPARPGAASVRRVDAAAPFALWVDAIGARLRRDLGRIAAGAPLPAIGADSICARCEMRGLCRRDFWSGPGAEPERRPDT